jgi:chaperone BCS1
MRSMAWLPPKVDCYLREFFSACWGLADLLISVLRTTNHLERLDPALSRPGRMDVWVEFKNASKWQAEALFRNFFPSTVEDEDGDILLEGDLEGVDLPCPPPPPSSSSTPQSPASDSLPSALWSMSPSFASSTTSLTSPPLPSLPNNNGSSGSSHKRVTSMPSPLKSDEFGAKNQAYMPPPVDEESASRHSAKPLDAATLSVLAKQFADSIPDDEFSVAALQGCQFLEIRLFGMLLD